MRKTVYYLITCSNIFVLKLNRLNTFSLKQMLNSCIKPYYSSIEKNKKINDKFNILKGILVF